MNELQTVPRNQVASTLNQKIKQLKAADANVIGNEVFFEHVDEPPLGYRYAMEIVNINRDPKLKEVYPQQGGDFSLTGFGLRRIAKAMNVRTLPGKVIKETVDSIAYRARAYCRGLDGQPNVEEKDYEFRLDVRADEFENKYRKKSDEYEHPDFPIKQVPQSYKMAKGDIKSWVAEQVRIEMIQCRKNALTKAQTGAQLRCIRALGPIASTYTAAQLAHPFVIVKLVQWLDPNNPIDRKFALEQSKVPMMMFPETVEQTPEIDQTPQEQAITAQMPLQLPSAEEAKEIEQAMEPSDEEEAGETFEEPLPATGKLESSLLDFEAMDANDRRLEISAQITRRQWKGKLRKDISEFTFQELLRFYEMLISLPLPEEKSVDPWE